MKKPLNGDQLTIRYHGTTLRAMCDSITEVPSQGVGAANFSIVSQTPFERGQEAQLIQGPDELSIQVKRVTSVGHHRAHKMNVVSFFAIFDGLSAAVAAAKPAIL